MSLISRLFNFCSNPNETRDIDTSPIDPRTPTFFHKKKTRHLSNIVNLPNSSLKASDLKKLLNSNTKENNESILNQSSLNDDFQEHNAVSMNSSDFMNPNKNISLNNEIHDETKNIKNEISNQHNESLVTDHQILEITQNLENKSTNQHTIQSQNFLNIGQFTSITKKIQDESSNAQYKNSNQSSIENTYSTSDNKKKEASQPDDNKGQEEITNFQINISKQSNTQIQNQFISFQNNQKHFQSMPLNINKPPINFQYKQPFLESLYSNQNDKFLPGRQNIVQIANQNNGNQFNQIQPNIPINSQFIDNKLSKKKLIIPKIQYQITNDNNQPKQNDFLPIIPNQNAQRIDLPIPNIQNVPQISISNTQTLHQPTNFSHRNNFIIPNIQNLQIHQTQSQQIQQKNSRELPQPQIHQLQQIRDQLQNQIQKLQPNDATKFPQPQIKQLIKIQSKLKTQFEQQQNDSKKLPNPQIQQLQQIQDRMKNKIYQQTTPIQNPQSCNLGHLPQPQIKQLQQIQNQFQNKFEQQFQNKQHENANQLPQPQIKQIEQIKSKLQISQLQQVNGNLQILYQQQRQ